MDNWIALDLGAAFAAGLMIGVERGWRLRREKSGTRVAGVRTYTLVGGGGGLAAVLGSVVHPFVAVVIAAAIASALMVGFVRESGRRDSTGIISAMLALALGLLGGAGEPSLAVAGAAVVTLILATRTQSHGFVSRLNATDVHAFARYAVIAAAVLPFLPNRSVGPLGAWNPFQLWLVVVLVTGFSFAGYIANRTIGAQKGVLATAVIGGAYSSTAVTASLAQRLGKGEAGPHNAGIMLASAVMYLRVMILVGVLSPSTLRAFVLIVGPAAMVAVVIALISWMRAWEATGSKGEVPRNPIELLPAFGFLGIVAVGAVATRWAQQEYGQSGIATSLFITGTFDVDAAIVTLAGLPVEALSREVAALSIAGTVVANMALKMIVAGVYGRRRVAWAVAGLGASTAVLAASIGLRLTVPL